MEPIRRLDERFVADLNDILVWAAKNGIGRHTRFHVYRDNIEWLRARDAEKDRAQVHAQLSDEGRLTEVLSAFTESIELVETISTLRQSGIVIPQELLRRAFSGPADAYQEDHTSNQARNAMFELSIGASAARQSLMPKLSIGNPDVSFKFDGRNVKMECKRVISENKVERRLHEGIQQLEKSVQLGAGDVGLVAISLSKLVNPGDKFLIADNPHQALSDHVTNMLRINEQKLSAMHRPAVAGFIFYLSSATYVPNKGYSPIASATIFPVNLAEQPLLRRLADILKV